MSNEELRKEFSTETGIKWENAQGEPDIDYVNWLENRAVSSPIKEAVTLTDEEILKSLVLNDGVYPVDDTALIEETSEFESRKKGGEFDFILVCMEQARQARIESEKKETTVPKFSFIPSDQDLINFFEESKVPMLPDERTKCVGAAMWMRDWFTALIEGVEMPTEEEFEAILHDNKLGSLIYSEEEYKAVIIAMSKIRDLASLSLLKKEEEMKRFVEWQGDNRWMFDKANNKFFHVEADGTPVKYCNYDELHQLFLSERKGE